MVPSDYMFELSKDLMEYIRDVLEDDKELPSVERINLFILNWFLDNHISMVTPEE